MGKIPKFMEEMQHREIEPEEIVFLVKEMAARHDGGGSVDWYSAVNILVERHKGDAEKVPCIMKRIECLMPMSKDPRMGGWSLDAPDKDCLVTKEAVFRAAAKCPLRATPRRMWFDADEFFDLALTEADSEGSA
jgi:hypothetical protein